MAPVFRMNSDTLKWVRDFKMLVTSVDILSLVKGHGEDLVKMKEVTRLSSQDTEMSRPEPKEAVVEAPNCKNGSQIGQTEIDVEQNASQDELSESKVVNGDVPNDFRLQNEVAMHDNSHVVNQICRSTKGGFMEHHRFLNDHDVVMNTGLRKTLATT